jgi:hypothetical protein
VILTPKLMKRRILSRVPVLLVLSLAARVWGADQPGTNAPAAPGSPAPAATNAIGPKIQFQTPVYDFGRAKSGEQVKYTYIFTNGGDQVLEVTGVQACGCITADWSRKVEPGQTGTIPISFNSVGYGGSVFKSVTVTCNDRANGRPMLQFKGIIWKPVDVIPQMAVLNLGPDSASASVTVLLTNNLPESITLSPPECNNRAFTAELKTLEPGKAFQVIVAPTAPLPPGSMQAQITLRSSSTNMPMITISVFANVQAAVTINPGQIALSRAPLEQPQTNVLNLINNSTNQLALSEPAVSLPGVDVQLKEAVPGRNFTAMLVFPKGFEILPGQNAELSIKSSLPQMPLLKVPISQAPRVATAQVMPLPRPVPRGTNRHKVLPPIELPPIPQ